MLQKDMQTLQNIEAALSYEWLETNGLGGWSSSSIIGCHTRRYHGLLVAATTPPAERMVLVSKLDETIISGNEKFVLGVNDYGIPIHPQQCYMKSFIKDMFTGFIYAAGGVRLKKTIAMLQGENTVMVVYQVISAAHSFELELLPLIAVRDYHTLMHANDAVNRQASFSNDIFSTKAYQGTPTIFIKVPGGNYQSDPQWYYNFNYGEEKSRGLDCTEDLFTPGKFRVPLKEGDTLGIIVSTDDPADKNAIELLEREKIRRKDLLNNRPTNEMIQQLVWAADQFIVNRSEKLKTVIAGYHWFTDWGRDTMISLPGLTLRTGRYEDAKKILSAFAGSVSMGMLPNRFQDNNEPPQYNTVDATLWFFIAVYKYLGATNDKSFVLECMLPVLKEIISWHFSGTRYNIKVDEDGLLFSGEKEQQLTWMDAKVGNWVVTPRTGKPVEIQALWYNALKIFAELLQLNHAPDEAGDMRVNAEKVKNIFIEKFWSPAGHYLYDGIDENGNPDTVFRPNQLFALSLPFALLEGLQAVSVLKSVEEQLYTAVGLKTLPATDPRYVSVYQGNVRERDAAYHQGTVWSWLLGPYIDAVMSVPKFTSRNGLKGKDYAKQVIDNFKYHLSEACIGSVSEIFDAEPPHHPRGCIAQAWGVAEILRVVIDYQLQD